MFVLLLSASVTASLLIGHSISRVTSPPVLVAIKLEPVIV